MELNKFLENHSGEYYSEVIKSAKTELSVLDAAVIISAITAAQQDMGTSGCFLNIVFGRPCARFHSEDMTPMGIMPLDIEYHRKKVAIAWQLLGRALSSGMSFEDIKELDEESFASLDIQEVSHQLDLANDYADHEI